MSKSDAPLREIRTGPAKGDLRTAQYLGGSGITAFDFETADGEPFMLSVAEPEHMRGSFVVEPANRREYLTAQQILSWLASRRYAGDQICVWYNLSFDADVFARALGEQAATELYLENQTTVEHPSDNSDGEIDIMYIPGKVLKFTLPGGNDTVEHYDVGNFARGGLSATADEWLETDGKLTESVEASRFSETEYRFNNWDTIREYAERDAVLTRDAARVVFETAEGVGVPCRKPISSGSVAAAWLRDNLSQKPGWGMNAAQEMAWDSFAGGRFEVFERGSVGEVAGPDINSAYPAVMSELPDPGSLAWEITESATLGDVRAAEYGFVTVTVTTDAERRIQPFATKVDDVVTYPAFESAQTTTLIDTFVHAVDVGLVESFEIERAALGYETQHTRYPFEFLTDVYDERKSLESSGRPKAGGMLKLVLNSLYGKTAQTTLKREILTERVSPDEAASEPYESYKALEGIPYVESQVAGSLFNPFIASYITGLTRLELHKRVCEYGLESETVMFATDCIMVHREAFDESPFMSDLDGDSLGEWDFDYAGEAFVVGSGVYEVQTPEYTKMGTRGFKEAQFESLVKAAREAGDGPIEITQSRPATLGEAIAQGTETDLSTIGAFRESSRSLTPDFDTKREWSTDVTWNDLLSGMEYGSPRVKGACGGQSDARG